MKEFIGVPTLRTWIPLVRSDIIDFDATLRTWIPLVRSRRQGHRHLAMKEFIGVLACLEAF